MIDRSQPPRPTENVFFNIPSIEKIQLSNGAEIFFVSKNNLPVIYVSLITEAGSKFDPNEKKGLAYLTSLLIDEGAGEFNALQLSDEFDKLGSIFSVSADQDHVSMSLLSLEENFERSLFLFSKVLTEPRFSQADFDREKKKLSDRILQLKDDAGYVASTVFEKLILRNSFYELPEAGLTNTINNITNDDVINFYDNTFSSQSTKIIVVGNSTSEQIKTMFENFIAKWKGSAPRVAKFNTPEKIDKEIYIIDKQDSAQCEIRIGQLSKKRNADDFFATRVMNTILGGQFSSRINLNLREAKGFTYGASSGFSYYKEAGLFEIHTAVNIENTAEAVKEILKEVDGIRADISTKEIDFAKSYLVKQYPSRFETYVQVAKNIESLVVHSLSFSELTNYVNNIDKLNKEEILHSARQNIVPDKLAIVLCGDKNKISEQIKNEFGIDAVLLDKDGGKII